MNAPILDLKRPIKFTCDVNCYVAYGRVSTAEQADEGVGLPVQRTAIKREIDYRGLVVPDEFWCFDEGKSGKDMNRPELVRALKIIASGQARGLVVSKLDRLSRSLLDFAGLMAQAQIGKFNLVALDLGLDLSTPTGELMANILATFAQFERRVIAQRTRDGMAELKAQGKVFGRPAAIPDEILYRIIRLRENTRLSYADIAAALNMDEVPTPQGGRRWYASTVRAAFTGAAASKLQESI
jgi:DNA invertase Pin-like site-specific DNA recombinase